MSDFTGFLAMAGLASFLVFLIAVVCYVLKSIGLYALAVHRGIENPWLAWIPIGDLYIMGLLVGEMDLFGYHLDNLGLWVPVIFVGGMIGAAIPFLGVLFSIALFIFSILFIYKLYGIYAPEQAVLYTILSILLGLFCIFIFVIRNNDPVNLPGSQPPTTF